MTELRPEICSEATQQGLMAWMLKRLKVCDGHLIRRRKVCGLLNII